MAAAKGVPQAGQPARLVTGQQFFVSALVRVREDTTEPTQKASLLLCLPSCTSILRDRSSTSICRAF